MHALFNRYIDERFWMRVFFVYLCIYSFVYVRLDLSTKQVKCVDFCHFLL